MIDVSLATKGMSSTVLEGTQQQTFPYPGTVYWFDPFIFHRQDTELDINDAENKLYAVMKLPTTINGCTLVVKQCDLKTFCHRRRSWTFICSHGVIMRDIQDSHFGLNSVGKLNVSVQSGKHKNSKGAAIKGNYEIWFLILIHSIIVLSPFFVTYWGRC